MRKMEVLIVINKEDKRTIEECIADLNSTRNPESAIMRGVLKSAVLQEICSLDDNVNAGMNKIGNRLLGGLPA